MNWHTWRIASSSSILLCLFILYAPQTQRDVLVHAQPSREPFKSLRYINDHYILTNSADHWYDKESSKIRLHVSSQQSFAMTRGFCARGNRHGNSTCRNAPLLVLLHLAFLHFLHPVAQPIAKKCQPVPKLGAKEFPTWGNISFSPCQKANAPLRPRTPLNPSTGYSCPSRPVRLHPPLGS